MPVRINLKELFPADPQQIITDKINFNFNKLLELGVGEKGDIGNTGGLGPAGPFGLQGNEGTRGNSWFVDSILDPNTLTFDDLLAGDFYLDSQNFAVWQYDGSTWQFVFDLTEIINNYLATSSSPFVRGLGIGSPNDDRFILFNKRGNTSLDSSQDVSLGASPAGNSSNNDILFLNNFNEDFLDGTSGFDFGPALTPIGDQVSTMSLFNSLAAIYVDHQDPLAAQFGRYHLELGSLYLDGGEKKLTSVVDNLKLKFYLTNSSVHSFSDHYGTAEFSLDIPDNPAFVNSRTTNSLFHFRSSKWDDTLGPGSQYDIYLGSKFALDEAIGSSGTTKADGILFNEALIKGNIGTAYRYDINGGNFPDETGYVTNVSSGINASYFMLDTIGASTAGLLLDSKTLQDGGNLIQLGTSLPREINNPGRVSTSLGPNSHLGSVGIAVRGNTIYTVAGEPAPTGLPGSWGYFNRFGIENPNSPISDFNSDALVKFDGRTANNTTLGVCATAPTVSLQPIGAGVSDLEVVGRYAYAVNNQSFSSTTAGVSFGTTTVNNRRTYFQVLETESIGNLGLRRIARLGQGAYLGSTSILGPGAGTGGETNNDPSELNCAYRLELKGKYAIVARNGIHHATESPFDLDSTNYTGGFAVIDISEPTAPEIVANFDDDGFGRQYLTQYDTTSILDTCLTGDTLFALCIVQNEGPTPVAYEVVMKAYDVSGLSNSTPTIVKKGVARDTISSGNLLTYTGFSKYGAISANDQYVYVGWRNAVRIYSNSNSVASSAISCEVEYQSIKSFTLDFPTGYSNPDVFDIKQFGNSVYVLAKAEAGGSPDTFVFKIDVSGGLENGRLSFTSPYNNGQIYCKKIETGLGGRFVIVGKHIYVALVSETSSETNLPGLLALDFDGFYTGGAHIENLRSEKIEVTQSVSIGDSLLVHGDASIAGSAIIKDGVSVLGDANVSQNVNVINDTTVGGDLTVGGNVQADSNVTVDGATTLNGGTSISAPLEMVGAINTETTLKSFATGTHSASVETTTIAATPTDRFVYVYSNRYENATQFLNGTWQMRITVGSDRICELRETVIGVESTLTDRRQGLSVSAQFLIPANTAATIDLKWEDENSLPFQIGSGPWVIYYRTQQLGL